MRRGDKMEYEDTFEQDDYDYEVAHASLALLL